jgi:hypothetical protein
MQDGQPTVLSPDSFVINRSENVLLDVLANDSAEVPLQLSGPGTPGFGVSHLVAASPAVARAGAMEPGQSAPLPDRVGYQPNPGFIGFERFRYDANDGVRVGSAQIDGVVLYDNEIWFPLDESGTTPLVRQGGGPATGLLADGNAGEAWSAGRVGGAVRFGGPADKITFQSGVLPTGGAARAFSCWMKTASKDTTRTQALFSQGSGGPGKRFTVGIGPVQGSPDRLALRLEIEGGVMMAPTKVNDGRWHHVVVSVEDNDGDGLAGAEDARIFVDGVEEPAWPEQYGYLATAADGAAPTLGNSDHAPGFHFDGTIDDVRFFPRGIGPDDALFLYENPPKAPGYTAAVFDPPVDTDGDGFSDEEEAVAGTDAGDPGSFPRINYFGKIAGGYEIIWTAVQGRTYEVQESENLKDWFPAPGVPPVVAFASGDLSTSIPENEMPRRFFRLRIREDNP